MKETVNNCPTPSMSIAEMESTYLKMLKSDEARRRKLLKQSIVRAFSYTIGRPAKSQ